MIYKFRVILDAKEDVFRDIAIASNATFADFHNSIVQAFGFQGNEMACFYLSDEEWNQGEEISLVDTDQGRVMEDVSLDELLNKQQTKLLYVYDFLSMWTFFVELADIDKPDPKEGYPALLFAHGELPDTAPEKQFKTTVDSLENDSDFQLGIDDYDEMDFDENWN